MHRIKTYGHVVVVRWLGVPQVGESDQVFAFVAAHWAKLKRPLIYISFEDREPPKPVRLEAMRGWDAGMKHVAQCYCVLSGGDDALGAVQDAFFRGMVNLAKILRLTKRFDNMHFVHSIDEVFGLENDLPLPAEMLRSLMERDGMIPFHQSRS